MVFASIMELTSLPDMAAAACVSRAWRANALASWPLLAARRWPHGASPPPGAGAGPAEWAAHAARRHATDAAVLRCLRRMGDLCQIEAALDELEALGEDAWDALERAATWSDPRLIGLRHWARAGLHCAAARRELHRMRDLIAKEQPEPLDMVEAALMLVGEGGGARLG
jgi:hypothetical protein